MANATYLGSDKMKKSRDVENDGERFWTLEMDEMNKNHCRDWLDNDKMEALVDENCGGIIGYISRGHIAKVIKLLNKR